jgi:Mn2+/Fe2+ NRAMP family transporter
VQLAFNLALIVSLAIFVALLVVLLFAVRPYKNFERGVATLIWAFPAAVLATMILV